MAEISTTSHAVANTPAATHEAPFVSVMYCWPPESRNFAKVVMALEPEEVGSIRRGKLWILSMDACELILLDLDAYAALEALDDHVLPRSLHALECSSNVEC
ncbi:hypothetical protein HG530_013045 [Fusarium avenaceum]|nr:hypothetical protein HG530_013045 [Fusarium avenaceum]